MHDITIIGSGIVGLTLACALGESGLRIAMVDQQVARVQRSETRENLDLRVSAITPASQKVFTELNIWPRIQERAMGVFKQMQVWDGITNAEINFDGKDVRAETLGYIIENNIMLAALYEKAKTFANIEFIVPNKIKNFHPHPNPPPSRGRGSDPSPPCGGRLGGGATNIELDDGQQIKTKLLIGADGANSQVRKLANIEVAQHDYQQSALIATVHCESPHQQTARQCFTDNTILAFLPLGEPHLCSIVWSVNTQEAERLLKLDAELFSIELTNAFQNHLGKITLQSERAIFPLQQKLAKKYVLPNLALIGDAAHNIHPMAGQGVNLGIADAACLAQEILTAQKNQRDFSSLSLFRRYERTRKSENLIMINSIDAIKTIFRQQAKPLQSLRTLGIKLVDQIKPLKNTLLQRAMGLI